MGKRVAVLGSNSFAGCDFVDLLLGDTDEYEILGISRSPEKPRAFLPYASRSELRRFRFRQLDINSDFEELRRAIDEFEPSYIVNFAAQGEAFPSWSYPQDFFQTNAVAFARLVDHLVRVRYLERFLHISSAGVYGTTQGPLTESTALNPTSPYAVSKATADFLLLAYFKHRSFPAQVVRPTNLYGPYQQLFRIIPKAIILLKQGQPVELHGGARVIRSFIHVRDASRGELAVLLHGNVGAVYNVSPDEAYPVRDIVAMVCEELGVDFASLTVDVGEREGQEPNAGVDSTKARTELGWLPEIRCDQGFMKSMPGYNVNGTPSLRSQENMSTSDKARRSVEGEKWNDTKERFFAEPPLTLGPYFSFIVKRTPRRLLHLLSYYKFAAKMIGPGKRVLDIGCSEGVGTLLLAEHAARCVGADIDADAVRTANETLASSTLSFTCADVLRQRVGAFDAVTTFDVIEHIYQEHEAGFLDALCRNIEGDGIVVIGTPNVTADQYASAHSRAGHVNLYSGDRLRALCQERFRHVFLFSANDEMVHTGFSPMAHYLIALCVSPTDR